MPPSRAWTPLRSFPQGYAPSLYYKYFRIVWKRLPGANTVVTLAFFVSDKEKNFMTLLPGLNFIKLFSSSLMLQKNRCLALTSFSVCRYYISKFKSLSRRDVALVNVWLTRKQLSGANIAYFAPPSMTKKKVFLAWQQEAKLWNFCLSHRHCGKICCNDCKFYYTISEEKPAI